MTFDADAAHEQEMENELDTLRAKNADLTRKGLSLCNQNGELLMQNHYLRTAISEAKKVIEKEAESYAIHGIQPPPYITKWLIEYGDNPTAPETSPVEDNHSDADEDLEIYSILG